MEIQKLKYFYTVAKLQHVTRAAEEIHIAQPALTQAMHSLEEEFGAKLFIKKGRNIILTETGEYLKNRLETLLPEFDALPEELALFNEKIRKSVKLHILAASTFVIDSIVKFRKLYPDAVFDFEQGERKGNCDILVTTDGAKEKGERCFREHEKREKIYLAVPKDSPYAEYCEIDLSEVKDEGFVMFTNARRFGVICNKFCSMAGFSPKILFESDSPTAVQNMIGTGMGVAFWPEYSWGKIQSKNVRLLPVKEPICERRLILRLYENPLKSAYAEAFYAFLIKQMK